MRIPENILTERTRRAPLSGLKARVTNPDQQLPASLAHRK